MAVGICQVPSLRFCVLIRGFDNHSLESKKIKIINITTGGNGFSIIAPPVKFKRSFQWSRLTEDIIRRGGVATSWLQVRGRSKLLCHAASTVKTTFYCYTNTVTLPFRNIICSTGKYQFFFSLSRLGHFVHPKNVSTSKGYIKNKLNWHFHKNK